MRVAVGILETHLQYLLCNEEDGQHMMGEHLVLGSMRLRYLSALKSDIFDYL